MNALRAVYQNKYKGGVVHVNDGNGYPACGHGSSWGLCHRDPAKWESVNRAISCKHCQRYLAKAEQAATKKLTLREILFDNGHR